MWIVDDSGFEVRALPQGYEEELQLRTVSVGDEVMHQIELVSYRSVNQKVRMRCHTLCEPLPYREAMAVWTDLLSAIEQGKKLIRLDDIVNSVLNPLPPPP